MDGRGGGAAAARCGLDQTLRDQALEGVTRAQGEQPGYGCAPVGDDGLLVVARSRHDAAQVALQGAESDPPAFHVATLQFYPSPLHTALSCATSRVAHLQSRSRCGPRLRVRRRASWHERPSNATLRAGLHMPHEQLVPAAPTPCPVAPGGRGTPLAVPRRATRGLRAARDDG